MTGRKETESSLKAKATKIIARANAREILTRRPEINLIRGSDIDLSEVGKRHKAAWDLAGEVIKRCQ